MTTVPFMRQINMRVLLLGLACLCSVHAVSAGRSLNASPSRYINPNTYQWVQMAISIRSKTCAELQQLDAGFRTAFTADVSAWLGALPNAATVLPTLGDNGQTKPCQDTTYKGVNYAGVRAALRFRYINSTLARDFLFDSAREGPCVGGYRTDVYGNVNKLVSDTNVTVAFNNGSRQNPANKQGTSWVWPVPPQRCDKSPVVTSPSPEPVVDSPAPAVPSPSPTSPTVPSPSPAPGSNCPAGSVLVSKTVFTGTEYQLCLSESLTSCTGVKSLTGEDRSFPLYSGVTSGGQARLVRCIEPISSTDCSSTAVDQATGPSYTVPVYSNAAGTGNVISCVRASLESPTPCPAVAPFYLVGAGPSSELAACIQKPAGCNLTTPTASWNPYTIPLYNADATVLLGCMRQVNPTMDCPTNSTVSPYIVPFVVRNANGHVTQCRLQPLNALTSCAAYAPATVPLINSNTTGAVAPVTGCAVPGNGGASSFPGPCAMPGYPVAMYNAAGQLVQCRPEGTQCDPANSGGFSVRYTNQGTLESCVDITLLRRRQLLMLQPVNGNTAGTATNGCEGRRLAFWASDSVLVECAKGEYLDACSNFPSHLTQYNTYTTELVFSVFSPTTTLEGCMAAGSTSCPSKFIAPLNATAAYPYQINMTSSAVDTCVEQSACAANPCGTNASYATCADSTKLPGFQCLCAANACDFMFTILSVSQGYKCVAPVSRTNNSQVSSVPCIGDASQTWVRDADYTYRLLGTDLCLTADESSIGLDITVQTCVPGNTYQQWTWLSDHWLTPKSGGLCADETTGPSRLVTNNCNSAVTQTFFLNIPKGK